LECQDHSGPCIMAKPFPDLSTPRAFRPAGVAQARPRPLPQPTRPRGAVIQRAYAAEWDGQPTRRDIVYYNELHQDIRFTGYSYANENSYPCLVCGDDNHTYRIHSTTLDAWIAKMWMVNMVNALYDYYRA